MLPLPVTNLVACFARAASILPKIRFKKWVRMHHQCNLRCMSLLMRNLSTLLPLPSAALCVHAAVDEFDTDGDGLLGFEEFVAIMKRDGFQGTDAIVREAVAKEQKRTGVSASDLWPAAEQAAAPIPGSPASGDAGRILAAFGLFDLDGDGKISCAEIGDVMRSLGFYPTDDDIEELVKVFDQDGDDLINFPEVCRRALDVLLASLRSQLMLGSLSGHAVCRTIPNLTCSCS